MVKKAGRERGLQGCPLFQVKVLARSENALRISRDPDVPDSFRFAEFRRIISIARVLRVAAYLYLAIDAAKEYAERRIYKKYKIFL